VLSVSPTTVAFGSVATNTTATSSFTLTNTGGTALTVTAVTPPAAPFSATSPITVNTTIAPNQTLTQTVTFTPTAAGAANGSYSITVNDGQAAHVVTLTGTGTTSGGGGGGGGAVPSPTAGGWSMLGTAKVVTTTSPSTLQLTDAATAGHEAGLAYWPTAVAGAGLNATFTALINSGTGADGLAFDLLDASAGNPVLGVDGGGLGFSGNHGIAVALDTYKNSVNPSNNFVGVATGAGPTTDTLAWAATSTNVPALRSAPVTVTVATTSTALTVTVNGTQVISWTGTIPANAYVAFSAGDGGLTDLHAVENVSITSGTSAGPGVLSVSPTTVAFGSVATNTTATSSFTLTNTGGTALTVTAVTPPAAPFSATSPITVNTTIAPNQTLTQTVTFTPTAAGAANGSYSITVNDGQAAHVVPLTGTGTTSGGGGGGGGAVPSPTPGGWSML